jgi:dTDP-4-dehydrorhamnose reductase
MEVLGTHLNYQTRDTQFFDTLNPDNPANYDLAGFAPSHILHAGALTHVDYCEEHEEESYKQTVESTKNVLAIAQRLKAKLIYISTDYVFDGKEGPYDEDAGVNPISVYGRHKLEAEKLVRNASPANLILRITNVYGAEPRGKNFVARIIKAAVEGTETEYKLPLDQYATPINAWDVARAMYLLCKDGHGGIFNIASTDYINRVQLAGKVLSYFKGSKIKITPCLTSELGQPAPRPLQGGLKTEKFDKLYPFFNPSSLDNYLSVISGDRES